MKTLAWNEVPAKDRAEAVREFNAKLAACTAGGHGFIPDTSARGIREGWQKCARCGCLTDAGGFRRW